MPERNYLQHGRRHGPMGTDPIVPGTNEWCMAKATGSVPGTNASTVFDLELAFGSGVDSGLYTQGASGGHDVIQINEPGTFRVQWTAEWSGTIAAPAEGQELLAVASVLGTGLATGGFGFGGLSAQGREFLRATGDDYSGTPTEKRSSGGLLHWPTNTDTPPTFHTSLIGMTSNQNTGSSLTLIQWVFIERVDLYMLSETDASAWSI